jgi:hypothetical protein
MRIAALLASLSAARKIDNFSCAFRMPRIATQANPMFGFAILNAPSI